MPKKAAKTRKLKTSIYMDAKQLATLKGISEETGIPMARLLRDAVDHIIKTRKK